MYKLILIISFLLFLANVKSQNNNEYWSIDTLSSFNQPQNPFTDPLSMWMLRQNFTLNAFQADLGSEFYLSGNNDDYNFQTYFVTYLPAYNSNSFSSMIGTSYSKNSIMAENDSLNKNLQDICLIWLPIQYTNNKLKLTFLYEHMLKGDANSLYKKVGNTKRIFIISSYNFNIRWQLSIMTAYLGTQMESGLNKMFVPAFQLRYRPNRKLVMTTGAPVLFAFEWSPIEKIDLVFSQILLDYTEGMIRYNVNNNIGISVNYKSTGYSSSDTYFKNESITLNNQLMVFNKISQIQKSVSLKLGIKTLDNIGIIISGGYKIGQSVDLYDNENEV
ncbi:hypothetical protein ACFLTE_06335, partial [Bacteroidota bacterium]